MKRKVDAGFIASCLPDAPEGFKFRVDKATATTWRVVLVHPDKYTYKSGVETTWGIVKGNGIYRSNNGKVPSERVCDLLDGAELPGWSCIKPVPNPRLAELREIEAAKTKKK